MAPTPPKAQLEAPEPATMAPPGNGSGAGSGNVNKSLSGRQARGEKLAALAAGGAAAAAAAGGGQQGKRVRRPLGQVTNKGGATSGGNQRAGR